MDHLFMDLKDGVVLAIFVELNTGEPMERYEHTDLRIKVACMASPCVDKLPPVNQAAATKRCRCIVELR